MNVATRNSHNSGRQEGHINAVSKSSRRIVSLDYIRVLLTVSILIYHLADNYKSLFPEMTPFLNLFTNFANGYWGPVMVTMFFMLSGIGLYYKHDKIENVNQFYYKRWKSIIPVFFIVYFVFYVLHCLSIGQIFYKDPPQTILLTITGMDGYSGQNVPLAQLLKCLVGGAPNGTYYLTGTWFLGPILILYLLYPIILAVFKRLDVILVVILAVTYCLEMEFTDYVANRTIVYCLTGFVVGMVFIKYIDKLKDWRLAVICFVMVLIMYSVKLPHFDLYPHVMATCMMIVGYNFWEYVSARVNKLNDIILKLSAISFTFFLYHLGTNKFVWLIVIPRFEIGFLEGIVISVLLDLVLSMITYAFFKWFISTKPFLKFEGRMLKIGTKRPIKVD